MKVLHVITGLGRGGAELMLARLIGASSDAIQHVVATYRPGPVSADIEKLGTGVHNLSSTSVALAPTRFLSLVRAERPDIVHAWMYHASLATLLLPRHVPTIIAIRQSLQDIKNEKLSTSAVIRTLGRVSSRAGAIIYPSHLGRQQHEAMSYFPDRGMIIPNGFDFNALSSDKERRARTRKTLGYSSDHIVVINVARRHAVKNHEGLVRAFGVAAADRPLAQLLLVGDGVDLVDPKLRAAVEESGVGSRIKLVGGQDDVAAMLDAADAFVLPSHSEAFPNVLVEAMAMSLPVVSTDVGDARLITGAQGSIVATRNHEALTQAIGNIIDLPSSVRRQKGALARQAVVGRYGLPQVVGHHARLYEQLRDCRRD